MHMIALFYRFCRGLLAVLIFGIGLGAGTGMGPLAWCSTIKLGKLPNAIVLDQNGQPIAMPTSPSAGPVVLNNGELPSYVAVQLKGNPLPQNYPTVNSAPATTGTAATTGPLRFDAQVKSQLDETLAANGHAAVYNGQSVYLVRPLPPLFGAGGSSASSGTTLAWLAASSSSLSSSASGSSPAGSSVAATSTAASGTSVQAQTLVPTNANTDPIMNSKLVQDLGNLFKLKSGKLVNWNQQSLTAIESDLGIKAPKNVAPKALASTTKPVLQAQVITGSVQPTPVPEPRTLVVFGLAAAALLLWRDRGKRCPPDR